VSGADLALEPLSGLGSQQCLQRISLLLTIIVSATGLAFCFFASSLCVTLILSALLAIVIDPLVVILGKIGLGRNIAAGLSVLCIVILVGLLTYGIYLRANSFADQLPTYFYRIQKALRPLSDKVERLQRTAENLNPKEALKEVPEIKVTETANWPSFFLRGVGSISGFLAIAGIAPFLAFFMLIRKEQMYTRFRNMFDGRIDVARFVVHVQRMVRGYVLGNLVVGTILSAATVALFMIIGLNGALPLGIVCGFLTLVPFLGGITATGIALAAILLQFDSIGPLIAVVLVIPCLHLVGVNFLVPKLIGSRLLIGPVAITVSVLFWGWLWGVMGVFLAVPLTAFIKLIADSHPRLVHLSNLLAHDPQPVPGCILIGGTKISESQGLNRG
jgi:predicted PurR-regulated permease PerM